MLSWSLEETWVSWCICANILMFIYCQYGCILQVYLNVLVCVCKCVYHVYMCADYSLDLITSNYILEHIILTLYIFYYRC